MLSLVASRMMESVYEKNTGIVSFTYSLIISGPTPENSRPPPLNLFQELQLCFN